MKKKNYKCCGKKYKSINHEKFNSKCLRCKKNTKKNKNLVCRCDFYKNEVHQGLVKSLNTMYFSVSANYTVCCEDFYKQIISYYDDLWDDYYNILI